MGGFFTREHTPGQTSAMTIRMLLVIIPVFIILIPIIYLLVVVTPGSADQVLTVVVNTVAQIELVMIDNGTLIAAGVSNPLDTWLVIYCVSLLAGLVAYGLLTLVALYSAYWMARRQGAA
jgi:hypothetical protein